MEELQGWHKRPRTSWDKRHHWSKKAGRNLALKNYILSHSRLDNTLRQNIIFSTKLFNLGILIFCAIVRIDISQRMLLCQNLFFVVQNSKNLSIYLAFGP